MQSPIEVNGITWTLKDNGVQNYYTTTIGKRTYDIAQNHGAAEWWVWEHEGGATRTLNMPPTPNPARREPWDQGGPLYVHEWYKQPVEYWLDVVSLYIQQGKVAEDSDRQIQVTYPDVYTINLGSLQFWAADELAAQGIERDPDTIPLEEAIAIVNAGEKASVFPLEEGQEGTTKEAYYGFDQELDSDPHDVERPQF